MATTSPPAAAIPRVPRRAAPRTPGAPSPAIPPPETAQNLWTTERAAAYLGVTRQTIYNWRVLGYGPAAIRYRGALRFRPEDLTAWVALQQEQGQ